MKDRHEDNDDMQEMMRRLEGEFNARRELPPGTSFDEPQVGQATPIPPQAGRVALRLPRSQPRVVYALIVINIVMYAMSTLLAGRIAEPYREPFSGDLFSSFNAALYLLGAKWGPAIEAGQYWRLLTPMVLHGGLVHLLFNSYATYVLGPDAEQVYGTWRFLVIYLLAGLAGNIASYGVSPNALAIGASGAIFGLIGALAAFAYAARPLIGAEASQQQVKQLIGLAAVNLVFGFVVPNIDNSAHIGGLIAGGLAGLALAPRYVVDERIYPPVLVPQGRSLVGVAAAFGLLALLVTAAALLVTGNR